MHKSVISEGMLLPEQRPTPGGFPLRVGPLDLAEGREAPAERGANLRAQTETRQAKISLPSLFWISQKYKS